MKKLALSVLFASIAFTPAFAKSSCLKEIESYVWETTLFLPACNLQDRDMTQVIATLKNHKKVTFLQLDNNNIGPEGAKILADELATSSYRVTDIYINNNHIGSEGAIAFAKMAYLHGFHAENNSIDSTGAMALANNNALVSLNLNGNNIGTNGVTALARSHQLVSLGIAYNNIGKMGYNALMQNKNITALDVSYTDLTADEIINIGHKPQINDFAADGNNLGDDGAIKLVTNKSFNSLSLADDRLSFQSLSNVLMATVPHAVNETGYVSILNLDDNSILDFSPLTDLALNSSSVILLANTGMHDGSAKGLSNLKNDIIALDVSRNHVMNEGREALLNSTSIYYVKFFESEGFIGTKATEENNGTVIINAKQKSTALNQHVTIDMIKSHCLLDHSKICQIRK